VRTLPRSRVEKVNKLMNRRYEEVAKMEEIRDLELEKLYPNIKAVIINITMFIMHYLLSYCCIIDCLLLL
jgi:hypothetical protein